MRIPFDLRFLRYAFPDASLVQHELITGKCKGKVVNATPLNVGVEKAR